MEQYAKLGISMVDVRNATPDPVAAARQFGPLVSRLAEIGPA
jgi:hypothetical protein